MQYAFLEKLATDGNISQADKERIYGTCSELMSKVALKISNPFKKEPPLPTWGEALSEQGRILLGIAALGAGIYGVKKVQDKYIDPRIASGDVKKIFQVKADLLKMPEFSGYQAKAEARFDEIVKIAPKIATMPTLAVRLVKDRLHSGFTTDDIQRLAQIQATYGTSSKDAESVQKRINALTKTSSAMPSANLGRLAATVVQILGEVAPDMSKVAALPWKRTPMQRSTAVAKQVLQTGAIVSGFGALVGLGAGTVNQAMDYLKTKKKQAKLKESFLEAMRRSDPAQEPLHANKDKALQAFQTLTHFAPNVAADPEAARAFMLNLISMDQGVQVGAIKDLSEIEKNLKLTRGGNPFLEGLAAGTEATGMSGALGKATGTMFEPVTEHAAREIGWGLGY